MRKEKIKVTKRPQKDIPNPRLETFEVVFSGPPALVGLAPPSLAEFTLTRDAALALAELLDLNRLPIHQGESHFIRTGNGHRLFITKMS